jgi:hypothetical protein
VCCYKPGSTPLIIGRKDHRLPNSLAFFTRADTSTDSFNSPCFDRMDPAAGTGGFFYPKHSSRPIGSAELLTSIML